MKNLLIVFLLVSVNVFIFGQRKTDDVLIHAIVQDMEDAWTAGDGAGFAQHFADEHDYFVWNGIYLPNNTKESNAQVHQFIFDGKYKDTKHYAALDKIRYINDDVAVIMAMSAVVPQSSPVPEHPQVLWSATMTKIDGRWKIISFHNADIEILESEETMKQSPVPSKVMFASWYEKYNSK